MLTCTKNEIEPVGRSSFLDVCSALNARDSSRKSAIDYILGAFVNDSVADLRRFTSLFCPEDKKDNILTSIECAEYFLIGSFLASHIDHCQDGFHDSDFALRKCERNGPPEREVEGRAVRCKGCLSPFAVIEQMETFLPSDRDDAKTLLGDVRIKFVQYYAHLHRAKAQQLEIEKNVADIVDNRIHNRVLMLADYKMKYEPIRYREKTLDFFGKKGISWHGIVVFHLDKCYDESGKYTGPEHLSMLFYDHFIQGDTQQDVTAVASILEAGIMRLKKDLPNVTEIILLSDNAACYQNLTLPVTLPFVAKANEVSLLKFIHTETQDGKLLVDAHFAIAMSHVSKIVGEGNDFTTPSTLVKALRSGGGLKNTAAELIRIDRSNRNISDWDELRSMEKKGLAWIGRNNEYIYEG